MTDIEFAFKCYRAVLLSIAPLVGRSFDAPATKAEIEELKQLHSDFPNDLIELYQLVNGEKKVKKIVYETKQDPTLFPFPKLEKYKVVAGSGTIGGWEFLDVRELKRIYIGHAEQNWEIIDNYKLFSSYPIETIKLYSYKDRIPFAKDGGGNFLGVDLNPDSKGIKNQIILYGRDFDTNYVIANSLRDFFVLLVDILFEKNYLLYENHNPTANSKTADFIEFVKYSSIEYFITRRKYPEKFRS